MREGWEDPEEAGVPEPEPWEGGDDEPGQWLPSARIELTTPDPILNPKRRRPRHD